MWIRTDVKKCSYDQIWSAMWIGTDVKGCCLDIIWGAMCIGTDVKGCSHDLIWGTMWTGTNVKGFCQDIIWGSMWNGTDDKRCCHDLFWGAKWIGKDVKGSFYDEFEVLLGLEKMWKFADMILFVVQCGLDTKFSRVNCDRRRGIGLSTGFIGLQCTVTFRAYRNVHPSQHFRRTQGWQRLLSLCSTTTLLWLPLPSIPLLQKFQLNLLATPKTQRTPISLWTLKLNWTLSELNWTLVRGILPLGGQKKRHLLRENIHQSLLRQLPMLPRKRATACTSPGKRVRSVQGPARYQVTSTPWRTCYTALSLRLLVPSSPYQLSVVCSSSSLCLSLFPNCGRLRCLSQPLPKAPLWHYLFHFGGGRHFHNFQMLGSRNPM
jgi:hypothetical protein